MEKSGISDRSRLPPIANRNRRRARRDRVVPGAARIDSFANRPAHASELLQARCRLRERAQAGIAGIRDQTAEPFGRVSLLLSRGDRGSAALADVPGIRQSQWL